jgi:hypothetical protein
MTTPQRHESTSRKPLRLWPAVVIAIIQLIVMIGGPVVAPDAPRLPLARPLTELR